MEKNNLDWPDIITYITPYIKTEEVELLGSIETSLSTRAKDLWGYEEVALNHSQSK